VNIVSPIPPSALPHPKVRSWKFTETQHGNLVTPKPRHRKQGNKFPSRAQIALWNQPWADWRRAWLSLIGKLWNHTLTPYDRVWWITQAAIIPFDNYRNVSRTAKGQMFFNWYQFMWFDLHPNRYIPFPTNAADFPHKFATPWAYVDLDLPSIIYATYSGEVVIDCLNTAPDGTTLEPQSSFMVYPPVSGKLPIGRHPWFPSATAVYGDHTQYTYQLATPFPHLRAGLRSTLVHRYCLRQGPPITVTNSPTAARNDPYDSAPWVNPDNIFVSDGIYATSAITNTSTDNIVASGFSFAIPDDATILGIQVDIQRRDTLTSTLRLYCSIYGPGEIITGGKTSLIPWPAAEAYLTLGGPADTWGATWQPSDLNDPTFAVWIRGESNYTPGLPEIDHVQVKVTYSAPIDQFTRPTSTPFFWS